MTPPLKLGAMTSCSIASDFPFPTPLRDTAGRELGDLKLLTEGGGGGGGISLSRRCCLGRVDGMSNIRLSPGQWARILDFLRGCTGLRIMWVPSLTPPLKLGAMTSCSIASDFPFPTPLRWNCSAREAAVADLAAKAGQLAESAGRELGDLKLLTEGGGGGGGIFREFGKPQALAHIALRFSRVSRLCCLRFGHPDNCRRGRDYRRRVRRLRIGATFSGPGAESRCAESSNAPG